MGGDHTGELRWSVCTGNDGLGEGGGKRGSSKRRDDIQCGAELFHRFQEVKDRRSGNRSLNRRSEDGWEDRDSKGYEVNHVTEVSARGKGDATSVIGIKFDQAVMKKNEELEVNLWIRAIAAEPRMSFQNRPDPNAMAGPGTAAAAGSPMKPATAPISTPAGVGDTGNSNPRGTGIPDASTGEGGLNAAGEFSANSRGVYGLNGLTLSTDASKVEEGSLITGSGKSVQLLSGTRLLLVAQ